MADYEIIPAVAGTKNKASTYNTNFTKMKKYVDDSVSENETYVQSQLTTYANINTLSTQGEINLTSNTVNTITPDGAVEFVLPTITGEDASKFHQILVQMNLSTVYTIDLGTTYYFNNDEPSFIATGLYDIFYEYDNSSTHWVVGAIKKGASA